MIRTDCLNSGIYRITCTPTGKFYIGSAINLKRRFDEHRTLLRHDKHYNPRLQNAWNKYGEGAFKFEIVEFAEESSLLDVEQSWIDETDVCLLGFNLAQKAGAGGSCKEWIVTHPNGTEETVTNLKKFCRKYKLNDGAMGEVAKGRVNQHKNFKVRYSNQSVEDWTKTLVRSTKFGAGWKGKYIITHPNGEEAIVESLTKFCNENNLSQGNMASICRGERRQHKGYTAKFLIEPPING